MITLVFLLCMPNGTCVQNAPQEVHPTVIQCEAVARMILTEVDRRVSAGDMPPHSATYRCIEWGQPA